MAGLADIVLNALPSPMVYAVVFSMFLVLVVSEWIAELTNTNKLKKHIFYKESPLSDHVLKRCKLMQKPFRPAFWASNTHLQTVLASVWPKPNVDFKREYVDMKDGGVVALDWAQEDQAGFGGGGGGDRSPVLIVLPGLTGDARGMAHMCKMGLQKGYRPVVFNKRAHGGSRITTPKIQSFGDHEDLAYIIEWVQARYPDACLVAAGISAGSGLLASYLGDYGSNTPLKAGVGISPGYDAEQLFAKPFPQPYDFMILKNLKNMIKTHEPILSKVMDLKPALECKTIPEFEVAFYCKLYGHKDLAEHWEHNNPMRAITNVRIPFLCISSVDDPICTKNLIPFQMFEDHTGVMLVATEKGGHCGFLEGHNLEPWAEKVTFEYLEAVLEYHNNSS